MILRIFAYSFSGCGVIWLKGYPCNSTLTQMFDDYGGAENRNPYKTHESPPQDCCAAGFTYMLE